MGAIVFNTADFRAQFPAFQCTPPIADSTLQAYFTQATFYISNRGWNFSFSNTAQKTQALYLMTAHIAALNRFIATGETAGIMTNATVDKVTVTIEPPPAQNQWQYWLQTTPYGSQLLALLQIVSVGGFYNTPQCSMINGFRWF